LTTATPKKALLMHRVAAIWIASRESGEKLGWLSESYISDEKVVFLTHAVQTYGRMLLLESA